MSHGLWKRRQHRAQQHLAETRGQFRLHGVPRADEPEPEPHRGVDGRAPGQAMHLLPVPRQRHDPGAAILLPGHDEGDERLDFPQRIAHGRRRGELGLRQELGRQIRLDYLLPHLEPLQLAE